MMTAQRMLLAVWAMVLGLAQVAAAQTAEHKAVASASAFAAGSDGVVAVVIDIPAGLHAQSNTPTSPDYIALEVLPGQSALVEYGKPVYPVGEEKTYPGLGDLNVYEGRVIVYVPFRVKADAAAGTEIALSGTLIYQLCDDQSCFMPQRKPWSVTSRVATAGEQITPGPEAIFKGYKPAQQQVAPVEQPRASAGPAAGAVGGLRVEWGIWTAFGAALLAGLLFNVMPCVLPVLPLKAIGFYEVSQHRRSKSILLGLVFSLGLISVFAVLAMLVLVLKVITWGEMFSQGWFVWTIVAILVVMGFALFGAFTVNLPTAVWNITPRHDTYGGNFAFGALTAVLATPCTAPLLPPLMLWAANKPAYVGVPAMVMVGVGMALPYLILSAFPNVARNLPRAGAGAELFKQMLGFLMLIAATYFAAGRLVEGVGFWWLVVAMTAVAAIFLVARTVQITERAGPLAFSAVMAVAMLGGTIWWTAKVTGLGRGGGSAMAVGKSWTTYSDAAFAQARASGHPVLVKFTANWCATCQVIEGTVFADAAVWQVLKDRQVTTIKADLTSSQPEAEAHLKKLNPAGGIPLTAIYFPGSDEPVILASVYTSQALLDALATGERAATAGR